MKVKSNAVHPGRQVLQSLLVGMLLCQAAPLTLAQTISADAISAPSANARVLEMFRGEVRIMHVPGTIKRIAIGNGKLITANVVDGNLMLLGEQDGLTSLVVWNEKGIALQTTVRIAKAEVSASVEQLRAVLKSVSGLQIDAIGSNIVLSGVVHKDAVGIIKAATQDMKNVINTTKVDEGEALRKTVHFKVQIMEVTRTGQRNLGIAWDSAFKGPQIGGAASLATGAARSVTAGTSYFLAGIASNITSQINFAVENGDAYVLAAPELNTKSGGTASFLAGGQVPIPQAGALGTTSVEYRDYGIKLSIVPVVDANNIISAHLTTEISQIDPSVTYGGMPGFLTRNTSSDISMRAGETLAISGLVSADAANNSNGMPFLSQVPIIGQLFRSDAFRSKKSDLVIFVTPVISDPDLSPNAALLARADKIDYNFRKEYGNPNPIVADEDKTEKDRAPREPVSTTPAVIPAPLRSTSVQAPVGRKTAARVAAPDSREMSAPVPSEPAVEAQKSIDPPWQSPSMSAPPGVAEALRMLNEVQQHPQSAPTLRAAQADSNGKTPPQRVGVLGTSAE